MCDLLLNYFINYLSLGFYQDNAGHWIVMCVSGGGWNGGVLQID